MDAPICKCDVNIRNGWEGRAFTPSNGVAVAFGRRRYVESPHDFRCERGIAEVDGRPPVAEGDARVEGFGCRPIVMMRRAPGPASESLQWTKPRFEKVGGTARIELRRPGAPAQLRDDGTDIAKWGFHGPPRYRYSR
jgi:hypothetical protein